MLTALTSGLLLGLSAGLAPGPLLTLILSQSLRHGPREGCKIALAPLITDIPIILVALLFASQIAAAPTILGFLSLAGGAFVLYLAIDAVRAEAPALPDKNQLARSWTKGILTNLLSPHPWLFWITVGSATLAHALAVHWTAAMLFLAAFYLMLVGSKLLIALVAGRSRTLVSAKAYRIVMRLLAALLVLFATLLLREGWRLVR